MFACLLHLSHVVCHYRTFKARQITSDGNSDSFLMIFLLGDAGQHEPRHVGSGNPPSTGRDIKLVHLYFDLRVSPGVIGKPGWSYHGPVDVLLTLLLEPELRLPHIVQDRSDHGDEDPPDEEHRLASTLLLRVPAVTHDQPRGGSHGGHDGLGRLQVTPAIWSLALVEDIQYSFDSRSFGFLGLETEARNYGVLVSKMLLQLLGVEDIGSDYLEMIVSGLDLVRASHDGRHLVAPLKSLLHRLLPWQSQDHRQTPSPPLTHRRSIASPVCPVAPSIASFIFLLNEFRMSFALYLVLVNVSFSLLD